MAIPTYTVLPYCVIQLYLYRATFGFLKVKVRTVFCGTGFSGGNNNNCYFVNLRIFSLCESCISSWHS